MERILDGPMLSDQREHASWGSLPHRETAQSIDHLMLDGTCLEDVPRPFEPEDLLNAFPLLAKPDTLDQDYR